MNKNLLGIDFEDWYHPQLVQPFVKNLQHEPKMFRGLEKILELLRNILRLKYFMIIYDTLININTNF